MVKFGKWCQEKPKVQQVWRKAQKLKEDHQDLIVAVIFELS
jgi:hypothetical protein